MSEQTIIEPELNKKLRAFIQTMDYTYGDGTCIELARIEKDNLYEALNRYSKGMFQEYSIPQIYDALIISELMCDVGENDMVNETRRLVGLKQSIGRVHKELKNDEDFRSTLIRSFIKNANCPFHTRLEKISNNKWVLGLIQKVMCNEPEAIRKEQRRKAKEIRKDFKLHYGKNKRPSE